MFEVTSVVWSYEILAIMYFVVALVGSKVTVSFFSPLTSFTTCLELLVHFHHTYTFFIFLVVSETSNAPGHFSMSFLWCLGVLNVFLLYDRFQLALTSDLYANYTAPATCVLQVRVVLLEPTFRFRSALFALFSCFATIFRLAVAARLCHFPSDIAYDRCCSPPYKTFSTGFQSVIIRLFPCLLPCRTLLCA